MVSTRKLTSAQQEVLDLINQGWELGIDLSVEGGGWLQKGGIGRGGERKTIKTSTVHALEYLGYIERGESHFPFQHYRLRTEKPTTETQLIKSDPLHGDDFGHPSFGTISFNHAQGGSSALFGSNIKHSNIIVLRICHAKKHLANANEYIFSQEVIVEAYMSPTQFADAITGSGSGGEAPITIQSTEKDGVIDQPILENKREQFEAEFTKRAGDILKRMDKTIEEAKDRNMPKWLVKELEITQSWFKSNIPYLAHQFSEQMDKTVTEAKAEVEAYVTGLVQRTGLEALADMKPQITEGTKESD